MDARWGFHQLKLSEETRTFFTLVTNFGTYCYIRLVMGWINATAEFQRHMNVTMGDALWRCSIVIVDDICMASGNMDDHKAHLGEVVSRLASGGHALKPKQGKLLQEEVEHLGHVLTPNGMKTTPGQREAIINMPYPPDSEGDVEGRQPEPLAYVNYTALSCQKKIATSAKAESSPRGRMPAAAAKGQRRGQGVRRSAGARVHSPTFRCTRRLKTHPRV